MSKRLWHRTFAVNIVKFSITSPFIEQLWWLPLVKLEPSLWNQQNFSSSYFWPHQPRDINHIVRFTIWHHLFLEFWLVNIWFFAHWSHQLAAARLENVRQLNIRRSKNWLPNCHIDTLQQENICGGVHSHCNSNLKAVKWK